MEMLYVEYRWGKADALRYGGGLKPKIENLRPIIPARGTNTEPPEDQYFKGALMLNSLRSTINDDAKWFADIHDFYQHFKYKTTMTEEVVSWWSDRTGMDLTPFFEQYLRHAAIPILEWNLDAGTHAIRYRWKADEAGFAMPILVGDPHHWTRIQPSTTGWQSLPWTGTAESFQVATDLFYVNLKQALP